MAKDKVVGPELTAIFELECKSGKSPEMIVIGLMNKYDINISELQKKMAEKGLDVSFSKVKYNEIAPFVNLDPADLFDDVPLFDLNRSRIPTSIFRTIVEDMDVLMMQYGPFQEHLNEEATSRTLAPIFNRLVAVFKSAIKNRPESIITGRITTKGRIEYHFKTFGALAILFVEVKHVIAPNEKLDCIAQVIAECDACDWSNVGLNMHVPIFGILCDAVGFSFFKFDGSTSPYTFSAGRDPSSESWGYTTLPLFPAMHNSRLFLTHLRIISEIVFDILLTAYCQSLVVYRDRSQARPTQRGPRKSLAEWNDAIKYAESAKTKCHDAEAKRKAALLGEANAIVNDAFQDINKSLELVPQKYKKDKLMNHWDDMEIEMS
ncbi:hypothetical protein BD410DRAFT_795220 [Rickenella mellea]|uniref:Uncharacterized protein n=1 Tax=Rickenella mellea TaxID=50990 RepID=A0A4Y7PPR1_9AGAM|nr:hypothetical protein BD410DRAFT_795220 [Rickenella mellea]